MTGRASIPDYSALHCQKVETGRLPAASTTALVNAKAGNTIVPGVPFAATVTQVPGITGRNLVLTFVDADSSMGVPKFRAFGEDQFGNLIDEALAGTVAGSQTITGAKIFSIVNTVVQESVTQGAAADNVSLGTGNKAGIPQMLSVDGNEVSAAQLVAANNTTITNGANQVVSATNYDFTYMALNAAFFGGTITAGDQAELLIQANSRTPDDRFRSPAR